jgi:hypothetical protein
VSVPLKPLEFVIDVRAATRVLFVACVVIVLALIALDATVNYSRWTEIGAIRRLFNMTREDALGSWFGVTVTSLTALTAWATVIVVRRHDTARVRRWGWIVIALFLSWMAIDDGAEIHERLGTAFKTISQDAVAAGRFGRLARLPDVFPSYSWQLLLLPVFAALGTFTLAFLWWEVRAPKLRALVVIAISIFALSVGLDFIEGLDETHRWNLYTHIANRFNLELFTERQFRVEPFTALRHFSKVFEEGLEIIAMSMLWLVLLRNLAEVAKDVRIRVDTASH